MAWQPIETAPKDGTAVLLYKPDEEMMGSYTLVGFWDKQWCNWAGDGDALVYFSYLYQKEYGHPTHWQPLPEPPEGYPLGGPCRTRYRPRHLSDNPGVYRSSSILAPAL